MIKIKVYKPAQRESYFSPVSAVFVFYIMNKRGVMNWTFTPPQARITCIQQTWIFSEYPSKFLLPQGHLRCELEGDFDLPSQHPPDRR
jgi:hypothetical protein